MVEEEELREYGKSALAYYWTGKRASATVARENLDLAADAEYADEPDGIGWEHRYTIYADDDFVVLFRKYDFVVWCFDKEVKLPINLEGGTWHVS